MKIIISIIFIAFLLIGCSDLNDIRSPRKNIKKVDEFVLAEGRWKPVSVTTVGGKISSINFTSITCDLKKKACNTCTKPKRK